MHSFTENDMDMVCCDIIPTHTAPLVSGK